MPHVFISYSRADKKIVDEIYENLLAYDILAWQDDKKIRSGERWHIEIDRAIQDSFAMLLICTGKAKCSVNVTYEWSFARGMNNVEILPIYFDTVYEIPTQLKEYQGYNYNDGAFWNKIIERLRDLQINDSGSNVRIPWTADPYLRELGIRAFHSTYLGENIDAIATLSMVDDPVAREILISGLNHKQTKIRDKILEEMVNTGFEDTRSIPKLKEMLLKLPNSAPNDPVTRILSRMGDDTVQALAEELYNKNPGLHYLVLDVIMDTHAKSMFPHIINLLDKGDGEIRLEVIKHIHTRVQYGWLRPSPRDNIFQTAFDEAILPAFDRLLKEKD